MCVDLVRHFGKDWIDKQQEGLADDFQYEVVEGDKDEIEEAPSLPEAPKEEKRPTEKVGV